MLCRRVPTSSVLPVLLSYCIYLCHSLLFRTWIIDDSGISFAYARNLIHGLGFVTQDGAEPVEGFSNPLWTLLMGPVFLSPPSDPTMLVKLISFALVLFIFLIINEIVKRVLSDSSFFNLVSFCVLVALSLNTSFVVWTTSGLENPLHVLLCVLYLLVCIQFGGSKSASMQAGLVAAGLSLNRPEGIIFTIIFPCLLALKFLLKGIGAKEMLRSLSTFLSAALIPVFLYQLFRVWYFANPLPIAYYVKGGPTFHNAIQLLTFDPRYVYKTVELLTSITAANGIVILLLLATFFAFALLGTRDRISLLVLLMFLLCCWAVYCLLPKDWMGEYRFATAFFVMFYLCFLISAARMMMLLKRPTPAGLTLYALLGAALVASTASNYVPRSLYFSCHPTAPFSQVAQKAFDFNKYAAALEINSATWLTPDMGASLYYSNHRVYDLTGLCDRKFADLARQNPRQLRDHVVNSLRPVFIHLHGAWSIHTGLQLDPRFRRDYVAIRETPFTANVNGKPVTYFNGDYVRRDAIVSMELFEKLLSNQRGVAVQKFEEGL